MPQRTHDRSVDCARRISITDRENPRDNNGSVPSVPTATPMGIPTSEPAVAPTATMGEEESLRDFFYEIADDAYAVILGCVGTDRNFVIPSYAERYEVREIGMNAFRNADIENVAMPETLTVLQQCAFFGCEALNGIVLPENLRRIGYGAFYECINLESAQIHEGVETIGTYAFYNTGITRIDLPDSLKDSCSSLDELIIPEGINSMNTGAFEGCDKLIQKL